MYILPFFQKWILDTHFEYSNNFPQNDVRFKFKDTLNKNSTFFEMKVRKICKSNETIDKSLADSHLESSAKGH